MTDDLPPRLTTELFRTASGARLQEIYRTLFHRIAEREDELHVFTDGGFSPRRVLDVLDDLEHHWPDPRVRPPLFGVPVGVKDLYRTAGYAIHAGSLLPELLPRPGGRYCHGAEKARLRGHGHHPELGVCRSGSCLHL